MKSQPNLRGEFDGSLRTVFAAEVSRVDKLRILIAGTGDAIEPVAAPLQKGGHIVVPVPDLAEATEALLMQRFHAVLVVLDASDVELEEFAAAVREIDRGTQSRVHTPVLLVNREGQTRSAGSISGIDIVVPEPMDSDALTLAIARLATAVKADSAQAAAAPLAEELPVLDPEQLKEQVAYDDELLVELIDLYFSERKNQSVEMKQALDAADYPRLFRVAHTIKGSLGSLHAPASRVTAQLLETAAHEGDGGKCRDFLPELERQLDALQVELAALRKTLG